MTNNNGQENNETTIALTVDDLTVAYNSKPAIWDVDLKIPEGVLTAVVGPNGAMPLILQSNPLSFYCIYDGTHQAQILIQHSVQ